MPTPSIPKVISLTITKGGSTNVPATQKVIYFNRTTGTSGTITAVSGKAIVSLTDDDYTVGDVYEFRLSGTVMGTTTLTTTGTASQTAAISTADTSATGASAISL